MFVAYIVSLCLNTVYSVKAQGGNYLNTPTFLHLREECGMYNQSKYLDLTPPSHLQ